MRKYHLEGARDIAPLGEKAGIVLKAPEMVSNERMGQ